MSGVVREVLLGIRTVTEMIEAFANEERCRRLVETLVWPNGRVCPACGYKRSIALAGRDMGRYRARPGLYQCCNGGCRFQFTATTRTPLHSTKLPLSTWLKALWLILQSDKGLSSIRLAEALGVSQPTAWRIGHALRLMLARETPLGGTIEIDEFFLGGRPKKRADEPTPGRGQGSATDHKASSAGGRAAAERNRTGRARRRCPRRSGCQSLDGRGRTRARERGRPRRSLDER